MEFLLFSIVATAVSPYVTKGLAYVLPPELVKPAANAIMDAAATKAGFSAKKA